MNGTCQTIENCVRATIAFYSIGERFILLHFFWSLSFSSNFECSFFIKQKAFCNSIEFYAFGLRYALSSPEIDYKITENFHLPLLWNCYIFSFLSLCVASVYWKAFCVRDLRNNCLITHIIVTQRYMAFKCHTACFACQWAYMHPSVFAHCAIIRPVMQQRNTFHLFVWMWRIPCVTTSNKHGESIQRKTNKDFSTTKKTPKTENSHTNLNGWRVCIVYTLSL